MRLLTQFWRTRCTTHKGQHLTLTFVVCKLEICATVAPNLQCSRRTVGGVTNAPKFVQCIYIYIKYYVSVGKIG